MSYWGYRFETICNISKPVSELRRIRTRKRDALSSSLTDSNNLPSKAAKLEDRDEQQQQQLQRQREEEAEETNEEKEEEDEVDELAEKADQIDLKDPELTGRLDGIVDTNLQYCTVARTKIGKNSIIMGAEVDCTSGNKLFLRGFRR